MPSEFDTFAAAFGVPSLMEHNQERDAQPEYRPPRESGLQAFKFDAISHTERGDQEYTSEGELIKITRLDLACQTSELTDHRVFELQRQATVFWRDAEWAIDLAKSNWSASLVTLGLKRREISRFEEMENAALR